MSSIPQFDVETFISQTFWLIVCGTFFYFWIRFVIMPRFLIIDDKRLETEAGLNDEFDNLSSEILVLEKQYDGKLANARNVSNKHIEEYRISCNEKKTSAQNLITLRINQDICKFSMKLENAENKIDRKIEESVDLLFNLLRDA